MSKSNFQKSNEKYISFNMPQYEANNSENQMIDYSRSPFEMNKKS